MVLRQSNFTRKSYMLCILYSVIVLIVYLIKHDTIQHDTTPQQTLSNITKCQEVSHESQLRF